MVSFTGITGAAAEARRAAAAHSFEADNWGFSAAISLEKESLVFFSVPYDKGWTATVNGNPVDVERVSNGFMAVRAEAGENTIEFAYETPGLRAGAIITFGGILLLAAYLLLGKKLTAAKVRCHTHSYDYLPVTGVRAAKEYTHSLRMAMGTSEPKSETGEENANDTSE